MISYIIKSFLMYIVSIFFPILGFLIPTLGVKEIKSGNKKNIFYGHLIITFLILIIFNLNFVIHYVIIYIGMEVIYIILNIKKENLNVYQKVILTSIFFTVIIGFYVRINTNQIQEILNETKDLYVSNFNFDKDNMELVIDNLNKYFLSIIYVYFFFENYMMYLIFKKDQKREWTFNYYFLIIYIILFFIKYILNVNNFYIINILIILKIPYIFYGIRQSYLKLEKVIKIKFLRSLLVLSVTILSYNIMFIIGSVISFKIFEEGVKNESNTTKGH